MDEYKDILAQALATEAIKNLSSFEIDPAKLVEMKCYHAIKDILKILKDESLEDQKCFWKIEKVVCRLETLGLSCGSRHDFC